MENFSRPTLTSVIRSESSRPDSGNKSLVDRSEDEVDALFEDSKMDSFFMVMF